MGRLDCTNLWHILLTDHVFMRFDFFRIFRHPDSLPLASCLRFQYVSFIFLLSSVGLKISIAAKTNVSLFRLLLENPHNYEKNYH
jgi:hypothetical protein